jgi:hypothetical protein
VTPASDPHVEGEVQRLLAEDPDIAELGIEAVAEGEAIVLRGCVGTPARRHLIADRIARAFPDADLRNEIEVAGADAPDHAEEPQ